jgi:hypothetical protein
VTETSVATDAPKLRRAKRMVPWLRSSRWSSATMTGRVRALLSLREAAREPCCRCGRRRESPAVVAGGGERALRIDGSQMTASAIATVPTAVTTAAMAPRAIQSVSVIDAVKHATSQLAGLHRGGCFRPRRHACASVR